MEHQHPFSAQRNIGSGGSSRGKSCLSSCWIFLGRGSGIYNKAGIVVGLVPTCGSTLIPIWFYCVCLGIERWLVAVGPECFYQREDLWLLSVNRPVCRDFQLAGQPGWAAFLFLSWELHFHPPPLPEAPSIYSPVCDPGSSASSTVSAATEGKFLGWVFFLFFFLLLHGEKEGWMDLW